MTLTILYDSSEPVAEPWPGDWSANAGGSADSEAPGPNDGFTVDWQLPATGQE